MTVSASPETASQRLRLAHFSDIHVNLNHYGWSLPDLFSKRVAGWANLRLGGRAWRFRHGEQILRAFANDLSTTTPDHMVFSGDAGCLGTPGEFDLATQRLGSWLNHPGVAVPGNHDHLIQRDVKARNFETRFAPWLVGTRPTENTDYPFVQQVGGWSIIAVNSSAPTRFPWDARGRVGTQQLERLKLLFDSLDDRPRLMVTHYPALLKDGNPEWRSRRLIDLDPLMRLVEEGKIRAWLHGHRHGAYHLPPAPGRPFALVCAGSVTQTRRWSYGAYDLTPTVFRGERRRYNPDTDAFETGERFEMPLV